MSNAKRFGGLNKNSRKYFDLGLSDGEYVVSDVKRHFLGRLRIWLLVLLVAIFLLFTALLFASNLAFNSEFSTLATAFFVLLALITPLFGVILVRDYDGDWMVVTNMRLIQNVRHTVFASENQEIGLDGVEDVSFAQRNVFEKLFNYGSLRLSTIGDEHTYIFTWVENPSEQVKAIRKAVTDYHENRLNGKSHK
jgi:hypothetical protein